MRNKILFFLQTCHGLLLLLSVVSLPILLLFPEDWKSYLLRSLILIIPLTATTFAINYCSHFLSYLGIGFLSSLLVFYFAKNSSEQIYLTIFSILLVLFRIPARLSYKHDFLQKPYFTWPLFFLIIYVLGAILHLEQLQKLMYYFSFGYIILILLYTNLYGLETYLKDKKDVSNLPGYQMIHTNRIMLTLFTGIAILFFSLLPLTRIDQLFVTIGKQFLNLLGWLIRLLIGEGKTEEIIIEPTEQAEENPMLLPPTDPAPEWLLHLLQILSTIIAIGLSIALIIGVLFAIYKLFQHFYRPHFKTDDTQEFLKNEIQFIKQFRTRKTDDSLRFQFHPSAYIRKRYKNEIKKGSKDSKDIPPHYTPTELEQYAKLPETDEIETLHTLYEKARYSKDGCQKEDVASIKKKQHK